MPTSRPPRPRPIRNIAPISPPIFNEEEETERDARLGERIQIIGENSIGTTPVGLQDAPDAPQEDVEAEAYEPVFHLYDDNGEPSLRIQQPSNIVFGHEDDHEDDIEISSKIFVKDNKKGIIWKKLKNKVWLSKNKSHKYMLEKRRLTYVLTRLNKKLEKVRILNHASVCQRCYQIYRIKNLTKNFTEKREDYICKDCIKYFKKCNACPGLHRNEDIIKSKITGKNYCKNCFSKEFALCDSCGKEERKNVGLSYQGRFFCEPCFNQIFTRCQRCDIVAVKERCRIHNGRVLCNACYRRFSAIKSYNYIPYRYKQNKLAWDNDLYLGIELEVETVDKVKKNYEDWARKTMNFLKRKKLSKYFFIKHDGTIDGFELVSHPLTLQYIHKNIHFNQILKWFRDNKFTSYQSGRCGLHTHLDRKFFNGSELIKLRLFYSTNRKWIEKFSKRGVAKEYCHSEKLNPNHFIKNGLKYKQEGKYWAIRMAPHGKRTVELRSFRGTLSYPRFIATLQFSDALAHFVKDVGVVMLTKEKSWNYFIEWCRRTHTYPHFVKYVTNRYELLQAEI